MIRGTSEGLNIGRIAKYIPDTREVCPRCKKEVWSSDINSETLVCKNCQDSETGVCSYCQKEKPSKELFIDKCLPCVSKLLKDSQPEQINLESMSDLERKIYTLRTGERNFFGQSTPDYDIEQSPEVSFGYSKSEDGPFSEDSFVSRGGYFSSDIPGDEKQETSWRVSLPGGLQMEIALLESPEGPMQSGTVLWTRDAIESVESHIQDSINSMIEDYDEYQAAGYSHHHMRYAVDALPSAISHYYGCSEKEALAEIKRVHEAYYNSAQGVELEERKRRFQDICVGLASGYGEDAIGEEAIDEILRSRTDMSDKSLASYILEEQGLSDYLREEMKRFRKGDYGEELKNFSDVEIVEHCLGEGIGKEDEEFFRQEWRQKKIEEVFGALEEDENVIEVFQKHGIYESLDPGSTELGQIARENQSFLDFFLENSKYSPEVSKITYGPRELARDLGLGFSEKDSENGDYVINAKDGVLQELPPIN